MNLTYRTSVSTKWLKIWSPEAWRKYKNYAYKPYIGTRLRKKNDKEDINQEIFFKDL